MGPYNAGPNLTPAPLTPALITPISNCVEYKKDLYFRFFYNFSKTMYSFYKMALIASFPLTLAFMNATRKNNADLGPAL